MHVIELERTRVGEIDIGGLPEGKWRPITEKETKSILFSDRKN